MKVHDTQYSCVFGGAGVQGFFGEGYRHHRILKWFGLDFKGVTFVAKTTTLLKNDGNMPLQPNGIAPQEFRPKCILPNFRHGKAIISLRMFLKALMLNAVKLSGPGAEALFEDGRWQKMKDNFFISFMPIAVTAEGRIAEMRAFAKMFAKYLPDFQAKVGLQFNLSCPNVGLDIDQLVYEAETGLEIFAQLDIPLMPKHNVIAPIKALKHISQSPNCHALCTTNTILWGLLPEKIRWKKLFGTDVSPLDEFGGGGLSGPPLLPLLIGQVEEMRDAGIKKPINAGGGITRVRDVDLLHNAGANSVFVASVTNTRTWRIKGIVKRAHQLFR